MNHDVTLTVAREELEGICRALPAHAAQQWLQARCDALRNEERAERESEQVIALRTQLEAIRSILKTAVGFVGGEDDVLELAVVVAAKAKTGR